MTVPWLICFSTAQLWAGTGNTASLDAPALYFFVLCRIFAQYHSQKSKDATFAASVNLAAADMRWIKDCWFLASQAEIKRLSLGLIQGNSQLDNTGVLESVGLMCRGLINNKDRSCVKWLSSLRPKQLMTKIGVAIASNYYLAANHIRLFIIPPSGAIRAALNKSNKSGGNIIVSKVFISITCFNSTAIYSLPACLQSHYMEDCSHLGVWCCKLPKTAGACPYCEISVSEKWLTWGSWGCCSECSTAI